MANSPEELQALRDKLAPKILEEMQKLQQEEADAKANHAQEGLREARIKKGKVMLRMAVRMGIQQNIARATGFEYD